MKTDLGNHEEEKNSASDWHTLWSKVHAVDRACECLINKSLDLFSFCDLLRPVYFRLVQCALGTK